MCSLKTCFALALCETASLTGLKQEAPEEEYAQQQDERDNDDFDQAHNRFLKGLVGQVVVVQQTAMSFKASF